MEARSRAARDVRSRAAGRDLDGWSGSLRCAARQAGEIDAQIHAKAGKTAGQECLAARASNSFTAALSRRNSSGLVGRFRNAFTSDR